MIAGLLLVPLCAAIVALVIRSNPVRRGVLVAAALTHTGLTTQLWVAWPTLPEPLLGG